MKKSIIYVCMLMCCILVSANAEAVRRNGRMLKHNRINLEEQVFKAPTGVTIDLTDEQYGITDVEAYYFELDGHAYYSFSIYNWDEDLPELRVDYETSSKTRIAGQHTVDLTTSSLELDDENMFAFSQASFQLTFVEKNNDGDPVYAIQFTGVASDGNTYVYNTSMPVYAYDQDNEDIYGYPSVIELEDYLPTAVANTSYETKATKVIRNGQVLIIKNGKTFNVLGAEVK